MSYSFSLSHMRAVRVYSGSVEARPPDDGMRASLEQALKQYPGLKNLNISDDARLARAKIIFKLEQAKSNGGADYTKWYSGDDVKSLFLQNIDDVIKALLTSTDFSPIISSYLGDGKTDRIKPLGSAPTMTYRTFLMRFTQDANLVARATSEGVTSSVEKDPEALRQKSRLEKVLKAFEEKHPEKEYKNTLFQAHIALINPNTEQGIRKALEALSGNVPGIAHMRDLSDEFNIDFAAAIGTDATMEKILRAIGDTQSAGKEMLKRFSETDLKDWKDSKIPTQKSLYNKLYDTNGSPKSIPEIHMKLAIAKYDQMLRDTNTRDPEYPILLAQRNQIIAGSAQIMFLDEVVTAHIRENGDKNLTTVLKSFNDMKGIHGWTNFSDENAKMNKEIGIMIGSMVLTAGASSLLAGAAVAVRTGAVAVRGAETANNATRVSRGMSAIRAVASAPLNGTASVLKGASSGLHWVEGVAGSRGIGFMVEGVKFTTVHAGLTSYFRGEGEKSGFNNFLGQLGMNTLMFGAFHGMEKFVTGPTASRMVAKFGLQDAKIAAFTVNNITYSLGDLAVMQALHAAETGKVEFDIKSLFESLAYRVAFGVGPQGLTKLKEQFPNQTKKFEAAYGSITSPKEWMEKLKKKNPAVAEGLPQGSFHAGGAEVFPPKGEAPKPSPKRTGAKDAADAVIVNETAYVKTSELNIPGLTRGTTLSFTHPGNQTYSAGEVVLKMLGNGQARVVSLPKGDRQGTMDYGLKNGDTINVSVTSDAQHQFLNLNHPKNGSTSLIMNDVGAVRIQGPVAKPQKPTDGVVVENTAEKPNYFREQAANQPLRLEWNGKASEGVPKGPYRNESRLAKLQEARQTLASKLKETGQSTGINLKNLSPENLQKLSGEVQNLKPNEQTQAFFKENGIGSWSQFEENLAALKKREFALRPADPNNARVRGGAVQPAEYLATSAKLEQYQAIAKSNPDIANAHSSLKELNFSQIRNLEAEVIRLTPDAPTQAFFKENGIGSWSQFEENLAALKKREFALRPADPNNARVRGGAVQPAEYLATSAKLEQYQAIATQYPNRNTSDFISQKTYNESKSSSNDIQNQIRRLDDLISRESARPLRPTAADPASPVNTPGSEAPKSKPEGGKVDSPNPPENTGGADRGPTGRPPDMQKPPEATPEGPKLSFRKDMQNLMQLDNAEFAQVYEAVKGGNQQQMRPYAKEMVEAAKYVRDMSDADVINYAKGITEGNRVFMGRERGELTNKASIVAENAALRYRITKAIEPILPPGVPPIPPNPRDRGNWMKENWNRLLAVAALIPLILALAYCTSKEENPNSTVPPPPPGAPLTPGAAKEYCDQCANGPISTLNRARTSQASPSLIMTDAIRDGLTQKWMKEKAWTYVVDLYKTHKTSVSGATPQTASVASSLEAVLQDPSVQNVQALQRCIGMAAKDDMNGQDGILGPITTKQLLQVINGCIKRGEDSPNPQPPATPASSGDGDVASDLPKSGNPI